MTKLRRSGGVHPPRRALTDPAKTLVAALAATELGRPAILIVESNQRAEALVEPLRWFYRAVTGKPGHRVVHLPALEVLPYDGRSPHAEISEDRAVALWRFANGDADLMVAPVQAALWRMREAEFYRHLARTIERDQEIPHRELLDFLSRAGYEKQNTCEMPGQYSVRGGIIDIFSPEAPQPVRVELLGDTIESIRAFDPNTQRSTNPMERATLLPLTEFPRRAEVLQRLRVPAASGREDDEAPAGFYPGWEFQEILLEDRKSTLFDLANDPLVIEDEPSLFERAAIEHYRVQIARDPSKRLKALSASHLIASFSMRKNGRWRCSSRRASEWSISASRPRTRRNARCKLSRPPAYRQRRRGRCPKSAKSWSPGEQANGLGCDHWRTRTSRRYLPSSAKCPIASAKISKKMSLSAAWPKSRMGAMFRA